MSEARTDTTQARPQEASAQAAEAARSGRHRGPAAAEESDSTAHGRCRGTGRTAQSCLRPSTSAAAKVSFGGRCA